MSHFALYKDSMGNKKRHVKQDKKNATKKELINSLRSSDGPVSGFSQTPRNAAQKYSRGKPLCCSEAERGPRTRTVTEDIMLLFLKIFGSNRSYKPDKVITA